MADAADGMLRVRLRCPVCQQALSWVGSAARCAQGHSFDVAREGYLNLLLSTQRSSKEPGDSPEMLRARRAFLDGGWFDPLVDALAETLEEQPEPLTLLDAGCGEGSTLGGLRQRLGPRVEAWGLDIARSGARLAARRHADARFVVANLAHELPFEDHSFDALISLFAPRNAPEFARVMAPGGLLQVVLPDDGHLRELRAQLLSHEREQPDRTDELRQELGGWELAPPRHLRLQLDLDASALAGLVAMTPLYWRSKPEARARVEALDGLRVTAAFTIVAARSPLRVAR